MKYKKSIFKTYLGVAVLGFLLVFQTFFFLHKAAAADLTFTMVRFDRLVVSTQTTGTVCATPTSGGGTVASVLVTFPTGYTLGLAATFTVNTTNTGWPSGATAWPGIGTATTVSSPNVTFPSTALTNGTLYCFNWINSAAVETASSASNLNNGTVTTQTSVPAAIDSGTYYTPTLAASPGDQIVVSANVNEAFSFALSNNTDALGTLGTGAVSVSPTPRTVTINTNARNGWMVWGKDSNAGLTSSTVAGATIASTTPGTNSTLVAGTAGYNTGVTSSQASGTGTITVATPFVGGTYKGGGLNTTYATLASSNGTGATSVLTLTNNAAISATTPAAPDYTDTITVVGAGLF